MNKLSLVGAVLAFAGVGLAFALLFAPSFVEVFLPDANATLIESPIGYLGVYTSGYDVSEVPADVLKASGLPTEAFEVDTLEFKFLFPAQELFYNEINAFSPKLLAVFDESLGKAAEEALPEFNDTCDVYMEQLEAKQVEFFETTIAPVLMPQILGSLWNEPAESIINGFYSITLPPIAGLFSGLLALADPSLVPGFLPTGCETVNIQAQDLNDTDLSCVKGLFGNFATLSGGNATSLGNLMTNIVNVALDSPDCNSLASNGSASLNACLLRKFSLVPTSPLGVPYAGVNIAGTPDSDPTIDSLCLLFPELTSCLTYAIALEMGNVVAGVLELTQFFPNAADIQVDFEPVRDVLLGAAGLFGFAVTKGYAEIAGLQSDPLNFTDLWSDKVQQVVYPASFDANYTVCELYDTLRLIDASDNNGLCSFLYLLENAGPIVEGSSNAVIAGLAPQVTSIAGLYRQCVELNNGAALAGIPPTLVVPFTPATCPKLFPSLFIYGAYSRSLDVTKYILRSPKAVFWEAAEKCKEDEQDLEALATAQKVAPLGAGFMVVGALLAIAAAFTDNTILKVLAAVGSAAGGATILAALLVIQAAPIYSSVGGSASAFTPLYEAGLAQLLGLVSIGLGVIAAGILLLSIKFCKSSEGDNLEGKTVKTTSI